MSILSKKDISAKRDGLVSFFSKWNNETAKREWEIFEENAATGIYTANHYPGEFIEYANLVLNYTSVDVPHSKRPTKGDLTANPAPNAELINDLDVRRAYELAYFHLSNMCEPD